MNNAHAEVSRAQQQTARAEDEARLAKSQAQASQAQAEAERAARERAEADAAAARHQAAQATAQLEASAARANETLTTVAVIRPTVQQDSSRKSALRSRLLEELNGAYTTRDTPRGLVVTIPNTAFRDAALSTETSGAVARISRAVLAHPGLRIDVEGHTDSDSGSAIATRRAEEVRAALVSQGLSSSAVFARGMGASRPLGSNSSPGGREQNRRVEIVISGEPIGDLASWDHTYSLTSR